ncbi:glycosyltransferase [Leptolyngbya sp. SLC-A1]|uniref:glycosyltransferase n=1 Tax=unclassified Leptolyngbya TaxID=2650499 RepID=UPI00329A63A1
MKGLYLSNVDPQQSFGYMPKIRGQVKGFSQLGFDMELICFSQEAQVILTHCSSTDKELTLNTEVLGSSGQNLFIRRFNLLKHTFERISQIKPDFLYIRYPRSEPLYLVFLYRVHLHFPNIILLSEFPTFPYDKEYEGTTKLKDKTVFLLDKLTRRYLCHFVDRVISINYDSPIFRIPTTSIDNGIHVSDYEPIVLNPIFHSSPVHFIGVANVSLWHGYDRLLKGLGHYYRQTLGNGNKVIFHVVGAQPPYFNELQQLVDQLGLLDFVCFYEPAQGKDLNKLFENCHLAIGVLGGHRKDLNLMSPLKNREYCARGIPFVLSHDDPDFPASFPYCLHLPADESPIDIKKLIDFSVSLSNNRKTTSHMREYAQQRLSWVGKLEPVRAYVEQQARPINT